MSSEANLQIIYALVSSDRLRSPKLSYASGMRRLTHHACSVLCARRMLLEIKQTIKQTASNLRLPTFLIANFIDVHLLITIPRS